MDDNNPFDPPSSSANLATTNGGPISMAVTSVIGGLVGLILGLVGIAALFFVIPGTPGAAEILFLLVGVLVVLVLPGAVTGTIVGFVMNSSTKNRK